MKLFYDLSGFFVMQRFDLESISVWTCRFLILIDSISKKIWKWFRKLKLDYQILLKVFKKSVEVSS